MTVLRVLKKLKESLRSSLIARKRTIKSITYLHTSPRAKSEAIYEAHLLVVKNAIYASMAKICVESFLYFHPKCTVVVHVDRSTHAEVNQKLRKLISREQVRVEKVHQDSVTWQISKLDLIFKLGNSNKFFMDADLKWNGPLNKLDGIVLFVNEFVFKENNDYKPMTQSPWFVPYMNSTMKNTSFFYWGAYSPTNSDIQRVNHLMQLIEKISENSQNPSEFNSTLGRISEQIALSLALEIIRQPVDFLKKTDKFKDGSYVESSYFGATQTLF